MSELVRVVPASQLDVHALTLAFNRAFEGYLLPLSQTPESLRTMMRTNDVKLQASVAALDGTGVPIGIGLLAVRGTRAWVGGMGVAPEWRGRGHGAAIMRQLLATAQTVGVCQVQLEVLEENAAARRLYDRLGFAEERPLMIFTGKPAASRSDDARTPEETVRELAATEALERFDELHAGVQPSWQRELASLRHMAPGLLGRGLFASGDLRAYALYSRRNSGLALLDAGTRAHDGAERCRAISVVVRSLTAGQPKATLRAINVPPGDPLGDVMTVLRVPAVARQREMHLELPS
jgi:ribosomal protein S18 acetylase RimI-like enzyme